MDQPVNPSKSAKRRILVVDDHPNTAITLARALSQLGPDVEVISTDDSKLALQQATENSVDLLITDMMMPGMNGLELIEALKSSPAGAPSYTILITAYDVPGLKESARRLKVNETIIKPVQPKYMYDIVSRALENLEQMKPQEKTAAPLQSAKILIVDDSPDNIALLERVLSKEGYCLLSASNGIQALEKTRTEMPDLLLLDINMPQKDGFEVLEEIRAEPGIRHIPVILITAARLSQIDLESGLNLGADDYLMKPFDRRELLARIRTKLRVKEAEDIIRRRNKELSVLPEIGKELSARLDIDELTDIVLHRTVETLGAMTGHIIVFNQKKPLHKEYHLSGSANPDSRLQLPPLNALLEEIKEKRESLIINDTHRDPRWQALPGDLTHSVMIVPMFGRRDLIGLLILNHEKVDYFNIEHQLLLQAIASQAAIALENAQLYASVAHEQQRLAAVLQSAADPILMFDAGGCLSLINPAAEALFTDYEARLGLPFARGHGYDTLIALLDEALATGKGQTGEIVWPDQRVFSALFTPIEEGGCVVLLHDVSHFKALERAKNEFISAATHDLKNPIGVIAGFSDLLPKVGPLNANQADFVEHIHSAAVNMGELVQNLLELAKIDMGQQVRRMSVDMNLMLSEIADEFQPQVGTKNQTLIVEEGKERLNVCGDPLQLKQALRNLVGNASKYTPAGGSIEVSAAADAELVTIRVKDTGYGIPADDLPFIFDRFYRVRDGEVKDIEGNGLGLAIVKSVIEGHGGQVKVESKLGAGSCFIFTLPLIQTIEQETTNAHVYN
ncbi:MAG: response regulator [Anaerolineales bacterium]